MTDTPSDDEVIGAVERFWLAIEAELAAPYPYQDSILREKYSEDVIYAKMEEMADRGLLDYGVSLRTAWVVEEKKSGRR